MSPRLAPLGLASQIAEVRSLAQLANRVWLSLFVRNDPRTQFAAWALDPQLVTLRWGTCETLNYM